MLLGRLISSVSSRLEHFPLINHTLARACPRLPALARACRYPTGIFHRYLPVYSLRLPLPRSPVSFDFRRFYISSGIKDSQFRQIFGPSSKSVRCVSPHEFPHPKTKYRIVEIREALDSRRNIDPRSSNVALDVARYIVS